MLGNMGIVEWLIVMFIMGVPAGIVILLVWLLRPGRPGMNRRVEAAQIQRTMESMERMEQRMENLERQCGSAPDSKQAGR